MHSKCTDWRSFAIHHILECLAGKGAISGFVPHRDQLIFPASWLANRSRRSQLRSKPLEGKKPDNRREHGCNKKSAHNQAIRIVQSKCPSWWPPALCRTRCQGRIVCVHGSEAYGLYSKSGRKSALLRREGQERRLILLMPVRAVILLCEDLSEKAPNLASRGSVT